MVIFRQLIDKESATYTYLLADPDTHEAILIDPVYEQVRRDNALLAELGLNLRYTLETHVHADHVTGASLLRQRAGSRIAVARASGAKGADLYLNDGDQVPFGGHYVTALSTPGHTDGCMTYVLDDESRAFTGDALLIRGCGRTDFQQGDPTTLYNSVHGKIFTLPADCLLYPGHDYRGLTVTTVEEERRYNPRLGGDRNLGDFAGYMNNLGLPHPKKIDIAVPANLTCGAPEKGGHPGEEPTWAPLTYTFGGIWEIQPLWLQQHLGEVQLVDVREPAEFEGPLGHLPGAHLIPLGELAGRTHELDKARPVVAICRAGGRSAQATVILQDAGFKQIASLTGGMLRWRAQHCPIEGPSG